MAGRGVGTRTGGRRVCGVDGNRRGGAEFRPHSMSKPGRRRAMRGVPDCRSVSCLGGRTRAEIARHARVQLRKAEIQEPGNATAEDCGDAGLGSSGGPPGRGRARHSRHDSDHHQECYGKAADGRCPRPRVEPATAPRTYWSTGAVRRRLEGIVDRGRPLAPEVIRARRRLFGVLGRGSGSERDELLAGAEPVAGEANHIGSPASLLLPCLGMPTFVHPVGDLFQRFLRRRLSYRPERAVL